MTSDGNGTSRSSKASGASPLPGRTAGTAARRSLGKGAARKGKGKGQGQERKGEGRRQKPHWLPVRGVATLEDCVAGNGSALRTESRPWAKRRWMREVGTVVSPRLLQERT